MNRWKCPFFAQLYCLPSCWADIKFFLVALQYRLLGRSPPSFPEIAAPAPRLAHKPAAAKVDPRARQLAFSRREGRLEARRSWQPRNEERSDGKTAKREFPRFRPPEPDPERQPDPQCD